MANFARASRYGNSREESSAQEGLLKANSNARFQYGPAKLSSSRISASKTEGPILAPLQDRNCLAGDRQPLLTKQHRVIMRSKVLEFTLNRPVGQMTPVKDLPGQELPPIAGRSPNIIDTG